MSKVFLKLTVTGFKVLGVSLSKYNQMFELFAKAQNSKKITISWHSRLSLSVSIEDYVIGKKEINLKGGVFDTLRLPTFW